MSTSSGVSASGYITDLASRGTHHFTTDQAVEALGVSLVAARAALRRLKTKGAIASPHRGFHVIVPPEYRRLGCLPADQFIPQLMANLGEPYYVALLSAGAYHGAAHQRPQAFQVMVGRNRPAIGCDAIHVDFVARQNVGLIPTATFNSPRGHVLVSTPEATAFDLVGYTQHAGGLDNVATVLAELAEQLDERRLAAAAPLSPTPWGQRLGHLLERVGADAKAGVLATYVRKHATYTVPLAPDRSMRGAPRDRRWRVAVNSEVEPDL